MRTSLNNIKLADDYLKRQLPVGDALLFEARIVLDENLRNDVAFQKQTYRLVQQYGRKKLKAETAAVHNKLFTAPQYKTFAQRILRIFR